VPSGGFANQNDPIGIDVISRGILFYPADGCLDILGIGWKSEFWC
jgi:hypothetical protein